MSICSGKKEMARPWMAALRDGGRWIVPTADTVYQRAAFKCVYLPAATQSVFSYIWCSVWPETDTLCHSHCAFAFVIISVYELLHCTHSHEPAAAIIWCLIHVIKPQRHLRALSRGYKRGGVAWSDKVESAHDFNCCLTMIGQVS